MPRALTSLAGLVAIAAVPGCSGDLTCPGDSVSDDGLGCVCPRDEAGDRQELARDGAGELLLRNDAPFCRPLCDRVDGLERLPSLVPLTGEYVRDESGQPVCGEPGCLDDVQESVLQRPDESADGEYAWLCVPLSP